MDIQKGSLKLTLLLHRQHEAGIPFLVAWKELGGGGLSCALFIVCYFILILISFTEQNISGQFGGGTDSPILETLHRIQVP